MPLPLVILVLPLLLLALPLLLPLVAVMEAWDRRQRQQAAARTPCAQCGTVLGLAALDAADAASRDEWAERRAHHPHVKWRVVRRVWAVCRTCGARYGFENGGFCPEPAGLSPGAACAASGSEPAPALPAPPG